MLGCQDFCGYYEWTFHYLRRRFGEAALAEYWSDAIAADSQRHYLDAARTEGLRGLYKTWAQTGVDEVCDWTVTLDEPSNLLRLDMRECPSKGYLLSNDLNADEDYCDHCMGWIGPALHQIGAEVAAHEHNHCGQCWWEIRNVAAEQPPIEVASDIRRDPRWSIGYLDRYSHQEKLPIVADSDRIDSVDVLRDWFASSTRIVALGANAQLPASSRADAVIVSGGRYALGDLEQVSSVLVEHIPELLPAIARVYRARKVRPLLVHPYLPQQPRLDFVEHQLPRATPILPLLIRSGAYCHHAGQATPGFYALAAMLAAALQKSLVLPDDVDATTLVHNSQASQTPV